MKIKIYSWLLAGAYLLWGCGLFHVIPKFLGIFTGFNIQLPFSLRILLFVEPYGWLLLAVGLAGAVIVSDRRFRSRALNPLFSLLLVLWMGWTAFTLLRPLVILSDNPSVFGATQPA
jgi:type II secretory pathway component PulF